MAKKTKDLEEPKLGKLSKADKDELIKKSSDATMKMAAYLKKNRLDPAKDWTDHPVHGEKIKAWVKTIRKVERKLAHLNQREDQKKKLIKPEVHPKVQTVKKAPNLYDYPDVDGKPMPRGMRKKYRSRMRALLRSNMSKAEAERRALQAALTWIPEEDPNEHQRSHLSNPEFEGNPKSIQSSKPTTEDGESSANPKKLKTKKEKRSRENRKALASKMNERKKITVKEED